MTDDKILKDAQYRKGLSIAFFNATNAAIELYKTIHSEGCMQEETHQFIKETRDWFLEEHKTYYAEVIANVGSNYNAKESIDKLKKVKTKKELSDTWLSFSEDERHDGDIRKVAKELKDKLE